MSDLPSSQLRLRVFAGPNGSGKSTVIKSVRDTQVNGRYLDFGIYVNADDILSALKSGNFSFLNYISLPSKEKILEFAGDSGLLSDSFGMRTLENMFDINESNLVLSVQNEGADLDRLAQIVARFLREQLLKEKKRFSFETVFSHESNLDIMRRAAEAGYKVYLYFVSTESPEINKYRVALRVKMEDITCRQIELKAGITDHWDCLETLLRLLTKLSSLITLLIMSHINWKVILKRWRERRSGIKPMNLGYLIGLRNMA